MKIVFGSVIYKEAWLYKLDFIKSLNEQQNCDFEILIINDNVEKSALKEFKDLSKWHMTVITKPHDMSIAELRVFLMIMAKKMDYELLVLGDFDDTFSSNRIQETAALYSKNYGFYYNPLYSASGCPVFAKLPKSLHNYEDILEYNFLGLSNTSLNLKAVSMDFLMSLLEGKTNIFDWYLYTRFLLKGLRGLLVENATTYYRIHEHNLAGIADASNESLEKELNVKILHYRLLKNYSQVFNKKYKSYKNISDNDRYLQYFNENKLGYWWNQIRVND